MTEEAHERIEELRRERRHRVFRDVLLIFTSTSAALLAVVLWFVIRNIGSDTAVYIQEAQGTLKATCESTDLATLSTKDRGNCEAAKRNELPQQLQSVVAGPPGKAGPEGSEGPEGDPGKQGEPGKQGDPGLTGPEGAPGLLGPAGPIGPEGQIGPEGPEGPRGEPGTPGAPGATGPAGPSCPDGYALKSFQYFGPNMVDDPGEPGGDDQNWLVCAEV